jgi:hypothetical protein
VHNTLFPNGYVDITDVSEQKRELLECFESQNNHHARYDHLAMGMAAWNARFIKTVEARYLELFFALPLAELLALVERFYLADLRATYRGHGAVFPGAVALHEAVMRESRWRRYLRRIAPRPLLGRFHAARVERSES